MLRGTFAYFKRRLLGGASDSVWRSVGSYSSATVDYETFCGGNYVDKDYSIICSSVF